MTDDKKFQRVIPGLETPPRRQSDPAIEYFGRACATVVAWGFWQFYERLHQNAKLAGTSSSATAAEESEALQTLSKIMRGRFLDWIKLTNELGRPVSLDFVPPASGLERNETWIIDLQKQLVFHVGNAFEMPRQQLYTLAALGSNPGVFVKGPQLLSDMRKLGYQPNGETMTLKTVVHRLRDAIALGLLDKPVPPVNADELIVHKDHAVKFQVHPDQVLVIEDHRAPIATNGKKGGRGGRDTRRKKKKKLKK